MSIPIKRRGRPPSSTHAADEAILNDWQAAQRAGETRKEFASLRSMSIDDLERTIQRARKRLAQAEPG
jgi:hypothetical protein